MIIIIKKPDGKNIILRHTIKRYVDIKLRIFSLFFLFLFLFFLILNGIYSVRR